MAERIQLKEPGSEFVMAVGSVHPRDIDNTEYFLFANGQKEILIPASSVERQLERLGVPAPEQLAGKTIKFSRSTKLNNFKKPYWNLDLASGAEQSAGGEMGKPTAGTPSAAPPADPASDDARDKALLRERSVYAVRMRQAFAYVLDDIEPICKQKDIGLTGDDVYKTAFSLWKSWIDAGIMK